jgi:hypothetical protein
LLARHDHRYAALLQLAELARSGIAEILLWVIALLVGIWEF